MDSRTPALFALVVALLLVASPLYLTVPSERPTYQHSIERVDRSAIPDRADLLHYETLSPEAQAAIDDALHDDGEIRGRANKPPEFFYSDYATVGQGIYFVERDGTYYRLTTYAGGGFFLAGLLVKAATVALGLAIGAVGLLSYGTDRRRIPTAFGAFGLAVLLASTVAPVPNWRFGAVAVAGAGTLAGVAAVGAMARRRAVAIVVTLGVVLVTVLAVGPRLGPGVGPLGFVSPVFIYGLAALVGTLGGGHLLGVAYEHWQRG